MAYNRNNDQGSSNYVPPLYPGGAPSPMSPRMLNDSPTSRLRGVVPQQVQQQRPQPMAPQQPQGFRPPPMQNPFGSNEYVDGSAYAAMGAMGRGDRNALADIVGQGMGQQNPYMMNNINRFMQAQQPQQTSEKPFDMTPYEWHRLQLSGLV